MSNVQRFFADTAVNVTKECVLAADYDALGERTEELMQRVGQLESELVEWKRMRNEAMAVATANRERITKLEAALKHITALSVTSPPSVRRQLQTIGMAQAFEITRKIAEAALAPKEPTALDRGGEPT